MDGVHENLNLKRVLNDFGCSHCFSLFLKFSSLKLVLTFLTILDTSVFYLFTRKRTAKNEIACFFAGFCISRDCKQWLPIKGAKLH